MRTDLQLIIGRLAVVRDRMNELISSKGGETQSCSTMYQYANAIATIPDFSYISNGIETFAGNTLLERIPECINSAAFTSMYRFAKGCTALKQVDRLYTSKVTTFVYAFHGCSALKQIDGLDTSSATTLGEAFHNCSSLVKIGSPLDVSNITSQLDTTFVGCSSLEEMEFTGTLKADIWLSGAPKLSIASLMSVINSLADLNLETTPTSKRIILGVKNTAKLSASQLSIITDKGWALE